jgi:hypothetical protein
MHMLRASTSRRRILGLAAAVAVGTGIGLGASSLVSTSGAATPLAPRLDSITSPAGGPDVPAVPAVPSTAAPSPSSPSSPSSPAGLTLDDAKAVAAQVAAPGRVVEAKEDSEPTGLQYDVTLLHADGTATTVEVDAATGRIVSTETDTDWDGS